MKTKKQCLTSPFTDVLEFEVMKLVNEGWRIEKPCHLEWSWARWGYVYRIWMVKDGKHVQLEEMQDTLAKHLHTFRYL